MAANTRAEDVVLLDLRGKSPVTEFFIIATGTSPRQMRTVVDELSDLGKTMGFSAWKMSGYDSARWIVLDCVNVVAHVFDTDSRDFYDLELLWGDSPRIDWRKELGLPPAPEMPPQRADEDSEDEDEARLERQHDGEGDADMDEDADIDEPVMTERPDESTGSNSVEFIETDPPSKRKQKGRTKFPTTVEEEEDSTAEERSMGPLSELPEAVEIVDEDVAALEEAEGAMKKLGKPTKKKAGKAAKAVLVKKKPAKAARKVATKKPVAKKVAAKKAAAKKPAPKKAAIKKSAAKKSAAKKPPAKKRRK